MWQSVFSTSQLYPVHDVNVKTQKGRRFLIDVSESSQGSFESTLTVTDNVTDPTPVSTRSGVLASGSSATDCFEAALQHIKKYVEAVDASDAIVDIHNPCNCPFVPQADQERIAKSLGISAAVRVN